MAIVNAKDKRVGQIAFNLPYMGQAVRRSFKNIVVQIVNASLVEGEVQNNPVTMKTQGTVQPMPEKLAIQMLGERSWKWWVINCYPDLVLATDDRIILNNMPFRIMEKRDCSDYYCLEYWAIEDYRDIPV